MLPNAIHHEIPYILAYSGVFKVNGSAIQALLSIISSILPNSRSNDVLVLAQYVG